LGGGILVVLLTTGSPSISNTNLDSGTRRVLAGNNDEEDAVLSYQIDLHFLDKLATKSYLHFDKLVQTRNNNTTTTTNTRNHGRPVGIPTTLRIITVDLPEVGRYGFRNGKCTVDSTKIYPDGIVPPERIHIPKRRKNEEGNDQTKKKNHSQHSTSTTSTVEVEQKVWIKSLVQCMAEGKSTSSSSPPSVQIMEADMTRFNPYHVRRIHHYGTLRYDPGKYQKEEEEKEEKKKDGVVSTPTKTTAKTRKQQLAQKSASSLSSIKQDHTNDQQENNPTWKEVVHAPWYQRAWKEEVMLRISGQVGFGESLQETSPWTRQLFGHSYQSTIAAQPSSWYAPLFFWRRRSAVSSSSLDHNNDGMDGSDIPNRASNKPHAVIVNGLALQAVPHSLRVIQKLCQTHDVPLFVIRDPRAWGANTHPDDVGQVLHDVQRIVKERLVTQSLQHAAGTAFRRGRSMGKLEENTKWQIKEALRQSKELANRAMTVYHHRKHPQWEERTENWSTLSEEELEQRLTLHGLLHPVVSDEETTDSDASSGTTQTKELVDNLARILTRYPPSATTTQSSKEKSSVNSTTPLTESLVTGR
jgi:hypothetical protein